MKFVGRNFAQLQKNGITFSDAVAKKFMTNEEKNIVLLLSVFSSASAYFDQYFLIVIHLFCEDLYIITILELPLMQFCEFQVVFMSTESGDDSKLDFLLAYNLPRIMIHHNAVTQRHFETTNSDHNLRD